MIRTERSERNRCIAQISIASSITSIPCSTDSASPDAIHSLNTSAASTQYCSNHNGDVCSELERKRIAMDVGVESF